MLMRQILAKQRAALSVPRHGAPCPPPDLASLRRPGSARYPGLQRERVEHATHLASQRLVDDLVLLDAGFAAEGLRDHGRRIVVAIAGQVADRHLGVGYCRLDHRFDIAGVHRHPVFSIRRFRIAAGSWPWRPPNLARTPFYVTRFALYSRSDPCKAAGSYLNDHNGLTERG